MWQVQGVGRGASRLAGSNVPLLKSEEDGRVCEVREEEEVSLPYDEICMWQVFIYAKE